MNVIINCGGRVFETSQATLRAVPGNYFFLPTTNEKRDGKDQIFLDYNPDAFSIALDYLRSKASPDSAPLRLDLEPLSLVARVAGLAKFLILPELQAMAEDLIRKHEESKKPRSVNFSSTELSSLTTQLKNNAGKVTAAMRVYGLGQSPAMAGSLSSISTFDWDLLNSYPSGVQGMTADGIIHVKMSGSFDSDVYDFYYDTENVNYGNVRYIECVSGPTIKKLTWTTENDLDLTMAAKGIFRDPTLQGLLVPVWSFPAHFLVTELSRIVGTLKAWWATVSGNPKALVCMGSHVNSGRTKGAKELQSTQFVNYWYGMAVDGSSVACEGAFKDKANRIYSEKYGGFGARETTIAFTSDELRQRIAARLSLRSGVSTAWME